MENLLITLILLVLAGLIALLIAGATNKVVIYYDIKDFAISLAPGGIFLITALFMESFRKEGATEYPVIPYLVLFAGLIAAVWFFIWSIRLSIFYNKSAAIGIIVGIFKVIAALFGTISLLGNFSRMTNKKSTTGDDISAAIWITILVWIGKKLINGEQVYIAKGWALPKKAPGLIGT